MNLCESGLRGKKRETRFGWKKNNRTYLTSTRTLRLKELVTPRRGGEETWKVKIETLLLL